MQAAPPLTAVTLVVRPYPSVTALNHVTQTISSYLDSSGMIPLDQACSSESIRLLNRLWDNSDPIALQSTGWSFCHHLRTDIHYYRHQFTKSLRAAVKRRDLAIVKWLLKHFSGCQAEVKVVEDAARYGRLEMLQYFLEYERQEIQETQEKNFIFAREAWWADCNITIAIEAGFPVIARWFYENVPQDDQISRRVMSAAVRQGDMATINWLLDIVYKPDLILPAPALDDAAAGGHMEILLWVFEHGYDRGSDYALEEAATSGRLDMVQCLVKHGIMQRADKAVERACAQGHLPIVQWFFECDLGRDSMYTMYNAVQGGHLDIVKYLDKLHVVDVAPNMMKEAAANGHLHIVKWLCEKYQHQFTYLFPPFLNCDG